MHKNIKDQMFHTNFANYVILNVANLVQSSHIMRLKTGPNNGNGGNCFNG